MTTTIPSLPRQPGHQPQASPYPNRDALRSSDPDGGVQPSSGDSARFASVTIVVPKEIQYLVSLIKSILDKLDPMERQYLRPIVTAVCVEMVFLKSIGQPTKDVLFIILFTVLFGLALPVWSNLKRMQCQLEGAVLKIDELQQSINSLESTPAIHPPAERVITPAVTNDPTFWTREGSTSKSIIHPTLKPVDSEPEGPDKRSVATDKSPYLPYELPAVSEPVAMDYPSPLPQTFPGSYHDGVILEGMDDILEVSDVGTDPVEAPLVIESLPSPAPTAPSGPDHDAGVILEGMDDMVWESDRTAGSSAERFVATPEPANHALPALREIKQQIEQFTEGRFERTSHLDLSEPHNRVQLRRCAVRLLMSSASLSPADFASPIGFLGPSESTPYYPTGDLQKDRTVAFNTAIDCLDDMEVDFHGHDDITMANTLCKLAQALSDLGLHKYALDTSGFALETLEHSYVVAPNDTRHHVASILSVQANILYDLKQNDKATDAAHRAVALFREHLDSQSAQVPELAFASLNYTVLLSSIGLKDESAAVAFELLGEVDESQPDMKDVSALCNLCLSNMRFDAEDGMDLAATEETIELTRTPSSLISQMALAGALLNKSKILSSRGENEAAIPFSNEAVTLLRDMSATRPALSLILAHALDTHAHHLSVANRKSDSYSIRHEAVELWQTLKASAPDPVARPLAWSLYELAKFRHQGGDRDVLNENFRIAEAAVEVFRGMVPPDVLGLADALYLLADRMLELDKNREAAEYAEESVLYFREASAEDQKYALDLINSLSLASSCLAYTERNEDAFEYAKQAVEVQHMRMGVEDKTYDAHLRWLLMNVVFRSKEMNKEHEALPWLQELQALDPSVGNPTLRRGSMSQENGERFKKQTSHWLDPNTDASRPNSSSTSSAPVASSSTVKVDKGKEKEVAPSPEARGSTTQDVKGKAKEVNTQFDPKPARRSPPDEEIFSPGAAAQRRVADLQYIGPTPEDNPGTGAGGHDHLNGLLGMGGLGASGMGSSNLGSSGRLGRGRTLGDMGGLGRLGETISGFTEDLLGRLNQGGAGSQSSSITRAGTWSGRGYRLNDGDA